MSELEIRLLGDFSIASGGIPLVSVRPGRQQALLAWLLLHPGQPQSRGRIAPLFWPDTSDGQARTNLRKLLHDMRNAWPESDAWFVVERDAVAWRTDVPYTLDVDEFSKLAQQAGDPAAIRAAISAYTGDLFPDCYDDWTLAFRDDLRRRFITLLETGIASAESERDYRTAILYAERLLQEEPLREDVHESLMRLHTSTGNRAAALRAYHACASLLERELGVNPGSEVGVMYQRLLAGGGELQVGTAPREPKRVGFVGRGHEWRTLQTVWRLVLEGEPSVAIIGGDPGVGKSRLAEEMHDWAERQGLSVYRASCHPGEETLPFSGITQLLARAPLSSLPVVYLRELARLVPRLLEDRPDVREPGPLQEGWQRRLLLESISHALLALQPVLLVIDDLQWCDADSIMALELLLRFDPTSRCLLLATARVGAGQSPSALFRDVKVQGRITEIELAPLDRDDTIRLAETLDPALSPFLSGQAESDCLFRETEGNPLFVVEVVRAGWKPGAGDARPLPRSLQAAIRSRFAELSEDARALLAVAATLGAAFRLPVLTHASGQMSGDLVRNIDQLWRERIIREQGTDGYDFAHGKLREVAYDDLSNARRVILHGRVAEAYQAIGTISAEPPGVDIARHFELAGRGIDAGRAYLEAAQAARGVYANESAALHYRRAVELLPANERLDVVVQLGETLQLTGDWDEAEGIYREVLTSALNASDPSMVTRCRIAIGDLLRLSGRLADGLEWLETARGELDRAQSGQRDLAALARVTGLICETLMWLARYEEAEEYARRQLSFAEDAADTAETATAYANLGTVYARRTQYDQALTYYQRNLELEEQLNDPSRLHQAMARIGNLYRLRGESQLALDHLGRQLSVAQQVGNVHAEALAASNLSNVMEEQGDFEAASMWVEKALATYRRLGDRQREAASLGNLGVLFHDRGDIPQAWKHIAQSIDMQSQVGDRRNAAVALGDLGRVYSDIGDFGHAMDCLVASILISLDIDNPQNVTIAAGAIGEAYLRQGSTSEAESFIDRAALLARLLNMSYWLAVELHLLAQVREQTGRLRHAARANQEALDLTAHSGHREVRFRAMLLQLRLRVSIDKSQAAAAVRDLQHLATEHTADEDAAAIEYEVWTIDRSRDQAREAAGRLYGQVYRRTPKAQYGRRLMELTGECRPAPPPLPDPPTMVHEWHADTDEVLKLLDELYQRLSSLILKRK